MRGLRRTFAIAVLAAALPASAQAAPTWLAPTTLDGPTPNVLLDQPTAVAMNERGDAVVAWSDYITQGDANPGNDEVQIVAAVRPAGGAFGPTQPLRDPVDGAFVPQLKAGIAGDGTAIVAFTTPSTPTTTHVQVASTGPLGTFGPARDVTGSMADSANLLGIDVNEAGDVAFALEQSGSLRGATGTVAGPVSPLDPALATGAYPGSGRVAIDPAGNVVWAWERDVAGPRYLVEVRDKPVGQGLLPTVTVSPDLDGAFAEGPAIAIGADGRAMVAYGFRDGSNAQGVRYNARSAPAANWGSGIWNTTPGLLSKPGQQTTNYGVLLGIAPDNTATATYSASDNSVWAASRLSGQQFAGHQALSEASAGAYAQRLSVSADGSAIVVFEGGQALQASRRDPGAAQFGATKEDVDAIGGPGYAADAYTTGTPVATDGHGNAISAYTINRCPTGCSSRESVTRTVLLDAEAPRIGDPSIPAAGVAGTPLSFTAPAFDVASAFTTSWAFGDGQSAEGTSVSHVYAAPGAYAVTVTATDAVGNASSRSGTVQVAAAPAATPSPGPGGAAPTTIATTVRGRFKARKRYAKVLELTLAKVPAGASVKVACSGRGCPLKRAKTYRFKRAKAVKRLAPLFTRRVGRKKKRRAVRLRLGARITVTVSSPTAIGRSFAFTVRRKAVKRADGCLAPGSRRKQTC